MTIIFILAVISAALVFLYYRETNPHISTALKLTLGILRFIFILIVLVLLVTPILHLHKRSVQQPFTAIALDISGSMNQTLDDKRTKVEVANDWETKLQNFLKKHKFTYKLYDFSNGLLQGSNNMDKSDTNRTDIFASLSQIQKKEKGQNLSDIILISDGLNHNNNNFFLLKQINVPVSVINLGKNPQYPDIAIKKVITNNPVYLNSKTEIKVVLKSNLKGENVVLKLWNSERSHSGKKDRLISNRKFSDLKKTDEVTINYTPQSIGFKRLRVSVELENGNEINLANNEREFMLNVIKNRAQVLILTSPLNWDVAFINRALSKNSNLKINLAEKRKDGYYLKNEKVDVLDLLSKTDLLVLCSKKSLGLTDKEYNKVRNFVKRGANLIYLDAIDDKIADILPLKKSKFQEGANANISLTAFADDYRSFSIGNSEQETQEIWTNLPPITVHFYTARKNAEILAIADLPTKNPVIAFSSYLNGHILMLAGNGLYRWKMWEDPEEKWFDEFVNSIVQWLINTDIKKRFLCTTDKLQYLVGEPVNFSALLFDEKMNPIPRQNIVVRIKTGDKVTEKYLSEKTNKYVANIEGLTVGRYNFQAECVLGNRQLVSNGEFIVESMPLEDSSTGLNASFLKFVASQTDGKVITTENNFEHLLEIRREPKQIVLTTEIELWKKWYVPLLAIFIISLELFIRKRKGLL